MAPLIAPDYWMNSQLSIARHYGGILIGGEAYVIHPSSGYLVKEDLIKYIETLNFEVVKKAVKRHGDSPKTHKILHRLAKIIKARKRAEKAQELELF